MKDNGFSRFPSFLAKSKCQSHPPPKFCAGLRLTLICRRLWPQGSLVIQRGAGERLRRSARAQMIELMRIANPANQGKCGEKKSAWQHGGGKIAWMSIENT